MRISSTQIFTQGLRAFADQQTKLAELQEQISTGTRLHSPSDDPAAATRVLELQQTEELNAQYQRNIQVAESRLQLQETTFDNVGNVLQRMRELTLQANNATQSDESRQSISFEIEQLGEQLLSLSNTIDNNGDFLFAGYQSQTAPFSQTATGSIEHVRYNGDAGQRSLQISRTRQMAVDFNGLDLFVRIPSDVALNESATASNTGNGALAPAHVFDRSAYVPGTYQIVFTGANTYNVVDTSGPSNVVVGATFTDSQNIDFQGIRTSISGSPDIGDSFTISVGQYQDIFTLASQLTESLRSGLDGAQAAANFEQSIRDIDNALDRVLEARTSVGGKLNALQVQFDDNESYILATRESIGKLRDTDLAEAISQLTLEKTTLDAAQAVFARITGSSLFNFLR